MGERSMKSMVLSQPGSPEVFQLQEWPTPKLQHPDEVLIQLKAAGINPIDTKLRQRGTFYPDQMPAILGCDGAGIVQSIGADVRRFRVGDEVYFCHGGLGDRPGTYCEAVVMPEAYLTHKPKTLSFAEAAAAPLVLITAWEALFDRGNLQAGQSVFVQAGAGGVGHVAIQLAKLKGAKTVYTTVSNAEKSQFVEQLGADVAISYPAANVSETILHQTGQGVDVSFDTIGGAALSQCFACTRMYGDVVTLLAPAADADWGLARSRNLRVSYELMLTPQLQGLTAALTHQADILKQCADWVDAGRLKIQLSKTFPLGAVADAHRLLEQGSMLGKIALLID
jgi:NADPH:quinone reductase